jgi:NADPH:quinone reductase-like Zn-dependent oxidoreductase
VKAIQLVQSGDPPVFETREVPAPAPAAGEVAVALRAAALNRRDAWLWSQPGSCPVPATLGSDGAGTVAAVGDGVARVSEGDEVVINPTLNWGDREEAAGEDFDILGGTAAGTFAERVVVPADNVAPRPARLSWEEAAALNLAGLTAWRAVVTRGRVAAGRDVLVTGAGGGVATFATQIATALGARVYVTSSRPEKIEQARELGATGGFDYRDPEWPNEALKVTQGGFDVIIDSAGPTTWGRVLQSLRRGGTLVNFGSTAGREGTFEAFPLYWWWRTLAGTTMGSPREYQSLLRHVDEASWRPAIDSVFALEEFEQAANRLESPERFGKVVIRLD